MKALSKLLLALAVSVIFAGQPVVAQAQQEGGRTGSDKGSFVAVGQGAPRVNWTIGQDTISIYAAGSPRRLLQTIPYDYNAVNLPDMGDAERVIPEDMNFDGYMDLKIVAGRGIANIYYHCWLWDQKQQQFVLHKELSELASPKFDAAAKTIHSFFHGSAVDSKEAKYRFQNGKLRLISALEHSYEDGRVVAREYRADARGRKQLIREQVVHDDGEQIGESDENTGTAPLAWHTTNLYYELTEDGTPANSLIIEGYFANTTDRYINYIYEMTLTAAITSAKGDTGTIKGTFRDFEKMIEPYGSSPHRFRIRNADMVWPVGSYDVKRGYMRWKHSGAAG